MSRYIRDGDTGTARVLSLYEVKNLDGITTYWNEYGKVYKELTKDSFCYTPNDDSLHEAQGMGIWRNVSKNYGRAFRLWTALPTEEQMKRTKWETT